MGRLGLIGLGLGISGWVIHHAEQRYAVHETLIATRPVFDPPGLKYAQINAPEKNGIRGWVVDMLPPPKRPGIKRVLAVGDSLTWGLGVSLTQAWPAQLEAALDDVEVFNLGMCGYDAEQGVSLITRHLADWDPDLVIWATYPNDLEPTFLMFGAHDKHPVFVGTSIPAPARLFHEGLSLWLVQHSAMFRSVQAAKLARVLANGHTPKIRDSWYPEQLEALNTWSKDHSIRVLAFAIPDHTQAQPKRCVEFLSSKDCDDQSRNYAEMTTALQASGLEWVDGQQIYAQTGAPHFMGPDRDAGHPTVQGHQALASGLAPSIQAALSPTD